MHCLHLVSLCIYSIKYKCIVLLSKILKCLDSVLFHLTVQTFICLSVILSFLAVYFMCLDSVLVQTYFKPIKMISVVM